MEYSIYVNNALEIITKTYIKMLNNAKDFDGYAENVKDYHSKINTTIDMMYAMEMLSYNQYLNMQSLNHVMFTVVNHMIIESEV